MEDFLGFIAVPVLFITVILIAGVVSRAKRRGADRRQEALFVASFPELQPHFHPEKVLKFVSAWRTRAPKPDPLVWNDPPGFGVARVRLSPPGEKGQRAELLDAAGSV